jgi:hypothetical protein
MERFGIIPWCNKWQILQKQLQQECTGSSIASSTLSYRQLQWSSPGYPIAKKILLNECVIQAPRYIICNQWAKTRTCLRMLLCFTSEISPRQLSTTQFFLLTFEKDFVHVHFFFIVIRHGLCSRACKPGPVAATDAFFSCHALSNLVKNKILLTTDKNSFSRC